MNLREKFSHVARVPKLSKTRIILALFAAIAADGLQLVLGPFGWAFGDQIIDVGAMVLTSCLIGFHWLLLPSFALELVPIVDEFPTWTACVIAVIVLRKRQQRQTPSSLSEKPAIDV